MAISSDGENFFLSPSDNIIFCKLHLLYLKIFFERLPSGTELDIKDTSVKNMASSFKNFTFWG